jgi:DNA-binding NarL/FixJ family response regulator
MVPIRVVICDDHPVVRSGIRLALEKAPDIEVVGEAADGLEALCVVEEVAPDVLVLDIEMPRLTGIEVTRRLREVQQQVQILIMSAHEDEQYIIELLSMGAAGYLTKDEAYNTIINAVRGIARKEGGWLSRRVVACMADRTRKKPSSDINLTNREQQVLQLLVAGKTNQHIADTLFISEKTVEKHMGGMFEKLGVNTRVEAAVWAVRTQLV